MEIIENEQTSSVDLNDFNIRKALTDSNGMTVSSRFSNAPWIQYNMPIKVFGAGGIGSWTSLFLAKSLPKATITVNDFDTVETHNLAGQFFTLNSVGLSKAKAVKILGVSFGVSNIVDNHLYLLEKEQAVDILKSSNIVISAFDNMAARKILFEAAVETGTNFVDGRLRATMFEVFYVDVKNESQLNTYRNTLIDDNEIDDGPCSFKQTSHVAAMIASYITSIVTTHASNSVNNQKRPLPFYSNFLVSGFMFKKMTSDEYNSWKNTSI